VLGEAKEGAVRATKKNMLWVRHAVDTEDGDDIEETDWTTARPKLECVEFDLHFFISSEEQ
jgi:hypothetical protein